MFAILRARATRYVAVLVAVALVAGTATWVLRGIGDKHLTAYFDQAVGLYSGADVRVLGVPVGHIDEVRPGPERVTVTMTVNRGVDVPADAKAVIVVPSVVAGRFVQLAPAYTAGPTMGDGAVIPSTRTATPVEIDQLYESLHRLATALGPTGANEDGALSDLLDTGAANLRGNGEAFGDMIEEFGKATKTLSGSQDDLFATIDNLQSFTTMLKNNDSQVRLAEEQLAQVSAFLAEDRDELAAALDRLATALRQMEGFIEDNRDEIEVNVDKLASLTQSLVDQRRSLAEAMDVAPLAATNLVNTYDPRRQTLNGRTDLNELSMGPGSGGLRSVPGDSQELLPLPATGPTYATPQSPQSAQGGDR